MLAFHEVVGLELAKKALLLLAVDPALGGVILPAKVGSGKSILARAFSKLLPKGTPFIELPVGVTEDRLLGGFNLEAALKTGKKIIEKGLLAKANEGVLYVDALNLMDSGTTAHVIDALSRGAVVIEREGMSDKHESKFSLIGTFNPDEGEVRMGLLDRVGLIVPFMPDSTGEARKAVLDAVLLEDARGGAEEEELADELKMLSAVIDSARADLAGVRIRDEQIQGLVQTALALGIEGNRADVFAVRAAVASAALASRMEVDDEDLKLAAKLVLMPRATVIPSEETQTPPEEKQREEQQQSENDSNENESNEDDINEETPPSQSPEEIQELLMDAVETELPENVLSLPFIAQRRGKTGSRGIALNNKRGKYVRSEQGELGNGKLALVPTLIAAMPFQKSRRSAAAMKKNVRTAKIQGRLFVAKDDIRIKKFRDKAGTLFIFIVDASGSMALNRMRQAKGAVAHLLQNAYIHRDQVALIAFRGKAAEMLLPPSQSVERAKRELDTLPTGGGTPLASALYNGYTVAKQAQGRGITQTTLVLITDGRGNVGMTPLEPQSESEAFKKEALKKEIQSVSALIASERIGAVVIDTQANYLSRGEAATLAKFLNGKYVYLPNAKAEQIANVALS
ncbi:MAG: magnesium chelatase ATPase subunit D [Chloroherpetonaceae bacterium]|nr:magnesium chelatase ATPase subunit D [Chloroherpetonaceae bacterium]